MIDNYIQMIHHYSSAGKLCETAIGHLVGRVIIKHSLLKWCNLRTSCLIDFKWTHNRGGYEHFKYIVRVCEQQRGTKEVETVSLKSKCIFGQKQQQKTFAFTGFTSVHGCLSSHWNISDYSLTVILSDTTAVTIHILYILKYTTATIHIYLLVNAPFSQNDVFKWPSQQQKNMLWFDWIPAYVNNKKKKITWWTQVKTPSTLSLGPEGLFVTPTTVHTEGADHSLDTGWGVCSCASATAGWLVSSLTVFTELLLMVRRSRSSLFSIWTEQQIEFQYYLVFSHLLYL